MKNLLLLVALVSFVAAGSAIAQDCGSHGKSHSTSMVHSDDDAAMKAAASDPSIERKVDEKSGKITYWKKETSADAMTVSLQEVEYCTKSAKFVNVSPSEKASCSKGASSKGCCSSKKGSATKVSLEGGKSCCTSGAKAGCCSKKSGASAAIEEKNVEVIKVKATEADNK